MFTLCELYILDVQQSESRIWDKAIGVTLGKWHHKGHFDLVRSMSSCGTVM